MATKERKTVRTPGCPGCSCTRGYETKTVSVYECAGCGGLHGTCYLGESYNLVLPRMSPRTDMDGARYFDFETLGAGCKIDRRHGWFDPETKLILQVG
jgi:hypothetical protein